MQHLFVPTNLTPEQFNRWLHQVLNQLVDALNEQASNNANNKRITNVGAPVNDTDAATLGSIKDQLTTLRKELGKYSKPELGPDINIPGVYKVADTQVVTAQQAAIADVVYTPNATPATFDLGYVNLITSTVNAVNAVLAAMRTHGLIDT